MRFKGALAYLAISCLARSVIAAAIPTEDDFNIEEEFVDLDEFSALAPAQVLESRASDITKTSRMVFAHFMIGYANDNDNQYDWAGDIALASAAGIDAFALNCYYNPNYAQGASLPSSILLQMQAIQKGYDAAGNSSTGFKMFISIDASTQWQPYVMAAVVGSFASHPAQLLVQGRPFVSTFSGEQSTFGQASISAGWQLALRAQLPQLNLYFLPIWSNLGTAGYQQAVVDGLGNWQGWPVGPANVSTATDQAMIAAARKVGKTYMAAVSPLFYRHDALNAVDRADDDQFGRRWAGLASLADPPDFIEIVTWNDFGESSYVGPVDGYIPSLSDYAYGFNHNGWLEQIKYYSAWYKTGAQPAISEDTLYGYHRSTSKWAVAINDTVGKPQGWQYLNDSIFATVFLSPNTPVRSVNITTGGQTGNFAVTPGINQLEMQFGLGNVSASLLDGSNKVLASGASNVTIVSTLPTYNFNYNMFVVTTSSLSPQDAGDGGGSNLPSAPKSAATRISTFSLTTALLLVACVAIFCA